MGHFEFERTVCQGMRLHMLYTLVYLYIKVSKVYSQHSTEPQSRQTSYAGLLYAMGIIESIPS
jgi:hypothetical protein